MELIEIMLKDVRGKKGCVGYTTPGMIVPEKESIDHRLVGWQPLWGLSSPQALPQAWKMQRF
jgi:hypothetical protein